MKILVNTIIKNAFSAKDAEKLNIEIDKGLDVGVPVTLDFSGIKFFSSLFFNASVCKYIFELGLDQYQSNIQIVNLSEVGEATYQRSYENAMDYYRLSPEERKQRALDIEDIEEE